MAVNKPYDARERVEFLIRNLQAVKDDAYGDSTGWYVLRRHSIETLLAEAIRVAEEIRDHAG